MLIKDEADKMINNLVDNYEFDPCDDCTADGDDYYTDENGEMQCACPQCPFFNWKEDD